MHGEAGVLRPSNRIILPGLVRPRRRAMIPTLQLGQMGRTMARMAGQVGWTPADLATPPSLWSNETSAITIVGGTNASAWNDISASGWHWGATGNPLIGSGPNSLRTLIFNGTSNRMTTSAVAARDIFRNVAGGCMFAIYKKTTQTAALRFLFASETPTAGASRFASAAGNTSDGDAPQLRVRRLDADAVGALTSATPYDTLFHLRLDIMDWANGDGFIWKDDALEVSNLALTTSGSTSNTAAGRDLALGSIATGGNFAAFEIVEIVLCRAVPTAAEIRKLFGYGAWRCGLQGTHLAADSPYLLAPP